MNESTLNFFAGLAHDLRTPLAAIGGYTDLLRLEVHGPILPRQLESLERIRSNQLIMAALITDVMDYFEVATGALPLSTERAPLEPLIAEVIAAIGSGGDKASIHVSRDDARQTNGDRASTSCDGSAYALMIHTNYYAAGAILRDVLHDALDDPAGADVRVRLSSDGRMATILVESSGACIAPELTEAVFLPFDRSARSARTPNLSRVLALPRARLTARALGGDVVAVPHDGVRLLRVELPCAS